MPANREQLIEEIRAVFVEKWAIHVESTSIDLLDSGLVDSITLVELLFELEQRFAVALPVETLEIDDFRTVDRIVDLVGRMRRTPAVRAGEVASLSTTSLVDARSPSSAAA